MHEIFIFVNAYQSSFLTVDQSLFFEGFAVTAQLCVLRKRKFRCQVKSASEHISTKKSTLSDALSSKSNTINFDHHSKLSNTSQHYPTSTTTTDHYRSPPINTHYRLSPVITIRFHLSSHIITHERLPSVTNYVLSL